MSDARNLRDRPGGWDLKNRKTGVIEASGLGRIAASDLQNRIFNRGLVCDLVEAEAFDVPSNPYAVDGKCHNAETGSYNHECGDRATWLGIRPGFASGFCESCRFEGAERRGYTRWVLLTPGGVTGRK